MPRARDTAVYEETQAAIKAIARQQMAAQGTAGISLRGIARALGRSAPALYRYFPTRDDLITALIVDGFNALADALEAEAAAAAALPIQEQIMAVLTAYRRWALANPIDFQLIYGNPIPGYSAPAEITVPASIRTFVPISRLIESARVSGVLVPKAPFDTIPASIEAHAAQMIAANGYPIALITFHLAMIGWAQLHGLIMLELFGHLGPTVGDTDAFYGASLRTLLTAMGLRW